MRLVRRYEATEMAVLLYSLGGGMSWWLLHLGGSALLVPAACEHDLVWLLNVVTVVTALGAVSAMFASELLRRWHDDVPDANERNRVLGFTGLLINVAALALILLEGVPNLVVGPCR